MAVVPALPGCHSQGDTLKKTEQNVTEAIELYLETLLSQGEDLPQETGFHQGKLTVPVPLPS